MFPVLTSLSEILWPPQAWIAESPKTLLDVSIEVSAIGKAPMHPLYFAPLPEYIL